MNRCDPLPPPPSLAREAAIFLDFDGTLVELADRPDAVPVDEELASIIARLKHRHGGRVALVSGRSIAQLCGFFGEIAADLALIGSHGLEIKQAGAQPVKPRRPEALDTAAARFAHAFADRAGVLIEEKSLGVAIHYRLDPTAEREAIRQVEQFAAEHELASQKGKLMAELRLPGHDKGSAIATLMQSQPFAGHMPIFLGDDVTDEAGFALTAQLGGMGILVGDERPTLARYRLNNVAAVRNWLRGVDQ